MPLEFLQSDDPPAHVPTSTLQGNADAGVEVAVGTGVLVATLATVVAVGAWTIDVEVDVAWIGAFFWLNTAAAKPMVVMMRIATRTDRTIIAVFLGFCGTGGRGCGKGAGGMGVADT